jgi:hypothetical protein
MSLATKNYSHGPIAKWPFSTSVLDIKGISDYMYKVNVFPFIT